MTISISSRKGIKRAPRILMVAGLLTVLMWASATLAAEKPKTPGASQPPAAKASSTVSEITAKEPTKEEREVWRKKTLQAPRPKNGCFAATYPGTTWREVPCKPSTPHKLYLPRRRGMNQIDTVGGGGPTDFSATVTGHISLAEGSFDSVTGVTSTNAYTLQLNTAPFSTSACSGSPTPATCQGWEQFVYPSSGGGFIQYWLLQYGPAGTLCPLPRHTGCAPNSSYSDGWCPFQFSPTGSVYCVVNAVHETTSPAEPMTSLGQLKVAGAAASGATNDSITVTVGGAPLTATGGNYFPDLGSQWQEAEFNVFGDGGGSQAVFNSGASFEVRTEVLSGSSAGPGCNLQSWTGETSNLTLVNVAPVSPAPQPAPALVFSQSNPAAPGPPATCAAAVSIGDTHLTTLNGLFYDFQAAGDFTLAEVSSRFEVQTRQVSGAPTWPNATVNKAVAARFGKTQVAVCPALPGTDQTTRVFLDGRLTALEDGKTLLLPEGGGIRRRGNVYVLVGEDGDSVRATVNSFNNTTWIDVNVGLGRWPSAVHGLIANPKGNINQIETRDHFVLTNPFQFDDLYHRYADSWRVSAENSMLSVCGAGRESERGAPKRPFFASDLEASVREKALGVCTAAGVKAGPLLDACTLDVAVIGQDAAAQVFVGAIAPAAVGTIAGGGTTGGGGGGILEKWWWLFLLLLLALILIVWLLIRKKP